jgi:phenylacetate-CoA ligase
MQAMKTDLVRGLARTFARTEWLSSAELADYRAPLIRKLFAHAKQNTLFYKDRLDFDVTSRNSIEKKWSRIPIVTRAEAVANRNQIRSRRIPPDSLGIKKTQTSGSTGIPFSYEKSIVSMAAAKALTERMFRWWSVDAAKSFAHIRITGAGKGQPPNGDITLGWHSQCRTGIGYLLSINTEAETQLRWLHRRKPAYLYTYSCILRELAVSAIKLGIDLKFAALFSGSTVLSDEIRTLCESAFRAQIADTYGSEEVDHIAAQCPDCGEYHISAEANVLEVLREDGSMAKTGEIGRVVVTSLYNYAMPLIRYELGDLVEVGSTPSTCGRGLPTLRRILGRDRNLFRFRDGSAAFPVLPKFQLQNFISFKQMQLVQTEFERIEIRYVPDLQSVGSIDLAAVTQQFRSVLKQPVEVALVPVEAIPRTRTGKYEDCISLVQRSEIVS